MNSDVRAVDVTVDQFAHEAPIFKPRLGTSTLQRQR